MTLGDVYLPLDAVEGSQRSQRIVAVETEVAREVVAGAERDADERQVALERDLRDCRQRAVAAGHPERAGRRCAGQRADVVPVAENVTADSLLLGGRHQFVGGRAVVRRSAG